MVFIDPRFGRWNESSLTVVNDDDSFLIPVSHRPGIHFLSRLIEELPKIKFCLVLTVISCVSAAKNVADENYPLHLELSIKKNTKLNWVNLFNKILEHIYLRNYTYIISYSGIVWWCKLLQPSFPHCLFDRGQPLAACPGLRQRKHKPYLLTTAKRSSTDSSELNSLHASKKCCRSKRLHALWLDFQPPSGPC